MSKNLPKVRALIHKACPQWYDLGLELGVEEATLNIIQSDCNNKQRHVSERRYQHG